MKFLLDANLSPRLASVLGDAGFATTHVVEVGLADASDQTGEQYTHQLDGKLCELRFHLERQAVRVTYRIASGRADRIAHHVREEPDARGSRSRSGSPGTRQVHRAGAHRRGGVTDG
jgi:hypothetical protein